MASRFAQAPAGAGTSSAFAAATNTLSGTVSNPGGATAGCAVRVFVDGSSRAAATATTASDGSWSVTVSGLSTGTHTYLVQADVTSRTSGALVVTASGSFRFDSTTATLDSSSLTFDKAS